MTRPLRIGFAGALYHLTARGDRREDIFLDADDRGVFLGLLGEVCAHFNWVCHAYCLMSNHYHLLIETLEGGLSLGMRQLNGVYTQRFNRSHRKVGHVFQGRFKGILVQKESHLLELARYIVLNPVRAGMVRAPRDWQWSSYRATAGMVSVPPWLRVDWILSAFGARRQRAIERYREFVAAGKGQPSPWVQLRNQMYLGDDAFVKKMQTYLDKDASLKEISFRQRRPLARSLRDYAAAFANRDAAIVAAYRSGGYRQREIADHFGLHYSSVSKIVKGAQVAGTET